jgi:predicted nucleotidyltransferase
MNKIKVNFKINYIYEVILYLLGKEAHGREIAKVLNTSLTRIQLILAELRNLNILDYKIQGRNNIYFIKKNLTSKAYIINAENYKLTKLLFKYSFLEPLFKEISEKYPDNMILLFGSYAKFLAKEDSDIDLYIETKDKKVKEEVHSMNHLANVKIGDFNKEDLLIKEIIKNKIIINRGETFYERLGFFK